MPRPAQGTTLQRCVAASLPDFVRAADRGLPAPLPAFVLRELAAYVGCGDFARGFVQLACEDCPRQRLVAFISCKTRGFCPSCGGKRMTELSSHLVDAVLPHVPFRQFVLTVPFEIRAKMAFDSAFAAEVKRALHAAVQDGYAKRAPLRASDRARTGGVTAIQRFGSGLNLHVHFHSLAIDGLFTDDASGRVDFHDGRPWNSRDVGVVLVDLVSRLVHRGVLDFDADVRAEMADLAEREPLGVASCMHRIALGPRRGQRVERIGAQKLLRTASVELDPQRPKARYAGFDLEAGTRIAAHDRKSLERLCRYLVRPPVADKRVRMRDDGKVELELKSRWPDGTTHLAFTPIELVEKIAALVPRPHENLLVYHGVLAGNARGREAIRHYGRPPTTPLATPPSVRKRSRSARDWAAMMRRGLDLDVLTCPHCGGRLRIRAILADPRVARPFAARLGLARTRAGPEDLPRTLGADTRYEPDPDFADPYDA